MGLQLPAEEPTFRGRMNKELALGRLLILAWAAGKEG